jgi:hypothetical protein
VNNLSIQDLIFFGKRAKKIKQIKRKKDGDRLIVLHIENSEKG